MRKRHPRRLLRLITTGGLAYLAGTFPSADLAARIGADGSVDVRAAGSGNPGGTNVAKVVGPGWGAGVMAADTAKGVVACRVGQRLAGAAGAHLAGPCAVLGHCFPIWNGFRGGKGVATSVGQVVATLPPYFPIDVAVAYSTITHRGGRDRAMVATAAASAAWVSLATLWWRRQWPTVWGPAPTAGLPLAAAASSAVIIWRFLTSAPAPGDEP